MKKYYQYTIEVKDVSEKEILIALLTEAGFDGFEEQPFKLIAISETKEPDNEVSEILNQYSWSVDELPDKNWNKEWESQFQPVILDGFCTIRAAFHQIPVTTPFEVIITPKMSFGTGHHATTWLMMKQMKDINFENQSVLDYGTGTGVLAILAEKLGAKAIRAIDIDEWSIDNSKENIVENQSGHIEISLSDIDDVDDHFNIILANINRNVLLENMQRMKGKLLPGGMILLSGILVADFEQIYEAMHAAGIEPLTTAERDGWGMILGRGNSCFEY